MSGGGGAWRKEINLEPSSVWGKHFSWDNFVMICPMSTVQKNSCFPSLTTNYWLLWVSGDHFVCFYNSRAVGRVRAAAGRAVQRTWYLPANFDDFSRESLD